MSLSIGNESQRQIPKDKKYTSNTNYFDTTYGYLQSLCTVETDEAGNKIKKIPKKLLNFTEMGLALELTRQTASTRFKKLLTTGLVKDCEEYYELVTLPNNEAFLISLQTLRKLISAVKDKTLSIYIYLLNRFIANKEQPFEFSITGLKEYVGMSVNCHTNNYIVTDILSVLQDLKLIEYNSVIIQDNGVFKTKYTLTNATNKLPSD